MLSCSSELMHGCKSAWFKMWHGRTLDASRLRYPSSPLCCLMQCGIVMLDAECTGDCHVWAVLVLVPHINMHSTSQIAVTVRKLRVIAVVHRLCHRMELADFADSCSLQPTEATKTQTPKTAHCCLQLSQDCCCHGTCIKRM